MERDREFQEYNKKLQQQYKEEDMKCEETYDILHEKLIEECNYKTERDLNFEKSYEKSII